MEHFANVNLFNVTRTAGTIADPFSQRKPSYREVKMLSL